MKQHLKTSLNNALYCEVKDYLVTGETFYLMHDEALDLLITQPQPSFSEINKYYESDAYISHTDAKKGIFNYLYQSVKKYNLQMKERLVASLNKGRGTLLDVGAGTGDFLLLARQKGWAVEGVEVNASARDRAGEKGIFLKEELLEMKGKTFDVITLWHVLEHLHNLEVQINLLRSLLKENGVLVVAVPNFRSYDAGYYHSFWAAFDAPRHLWHFSRTSIQKLFDTWFNVEAVYPMLFDAYYVSLLSEKYKTGNSFSLMALWIAFKSNWRARKTKEYSSLIYCLRKTN